MLDICALVYLILEGFVYAHYVWGFAKDYVTACADSFGLFDSFI